MRQDFSPAGTCALQKDGTAAPCASARSSSPFSTLRLGLCLLGTLCGMLWIAPAVFCGQSSSGKFISPDRSFELTVPLRYGVLTGSNKTTPSYLSLCEDKSIVCITFPNDRYTGTTFNGASVEITMLPARTRQVCLDPGKYDVSTSPDAEFRVDAKIPSRTIDGTRFLHSSVVAAAMSHDVVSDQYRGFDHGRCYQIETRVAFTNFSVYSPGAIKQFTQADQSHVIAELSRIVDSFRAFPPPNL